MYSLIVLGIPKKFVVIKFVAVLKNDAASG